MSSNQISLGKCAECGRMVSREELSNLIGTKYYHRYCWITNHTVAQA